MSHHPYCFLLVSLDVRHNPKGITVISWSLTPVIILLLHVRPLNKHLSIKLYITLKRNKSLIVKAIIRLHVRLTSWCVLRDAEQGHIPICTAGSIIIKIWSIVGLSFM